jgi:hypothetical protein
MDRRLHTNNCLCPCRHCVWCRGGFGALTSDRLAGDQLHESTGLVAWPIHPEKGLVQFVIPIAGPSSRHTQMSRIRADACI